MAKLLKIKKRKISSKKSVDEISPEIVVVGNYKTRQLDWIKKNGVYNWPVREGDEFDEKKFSQIKELWLYADVKSTRHVFAAKFVGKMSREGFITAYPTYTKLGKSKNKAYYVFKTTPLDYVPAAAGQIVVARAADFGRRSVKVKKAIDQFKADGEFAPLAAYLPSDLAKVQRQQFRVCEGALQLDFFAEIGIVAHQNNKELAIADLDSPVVFQLPEQRAEHPHHIPEVNRPVQDAGFTAIELFAGIGGFRVACNHLGIRTIWANDIDRKAATVYAANFGDGELQVGDINELKEHIPAHDILTGGFPCQPFSKAGKKQGVADIRGTLFEAIVDIVHRRRPRYFVLENVANLLSLDNGEHFKTILNALVGLGYMVEWKVFNAVKLGLPQHRLRIIIVGTRDLEVPETCLLTETEEGSLPFGAGNLINDMTQWPSILDIRRKMPNWGMAKNGRYIAYPIKNQEQVAPPQMLADVLQDDVPADFDFTEDTEGRIENSVFVNKMYDGVRILWNQGGGARMGYSIFGTDGVAPTLTASSSRHYERYQIGNRFRRLTNIEYARIQGFPDNHCQAVSVYDQYKLFGNALPPAMAEWVLNRIIHDIRRRVREDEDLFNRRGV